MAHGITGLSWLAMAALIGNPVGSRTPPAFMAVGLALTRLGHFPVVMAAANSTINMPPQVGAGRIDIKVTAKWVGTAAPVAVHLLRCMAVAISTVAWATMPTAATAVMAMQVTAMRGATAVIMVATPAMDGRAIMAAMWPGDIIWLRNGADRAVSMGIALAPVIAVSSTALSRLVVDTTASVATWRWAEWPPCVGTSAVLILANSAGGSMASRDMARMVLP